MTPSAIRPPLPGPVRVAMIGAGEMSNLVHYPSLAGFDDVELVGICDLLEDRLTATADKYRIKARYRDYQAMVKELKPDAVYVIGQPNIMYDLWVWCLQQGVNLCIEKPMGLSLHQARNLAYLAEKHRCITQVSFQRRIAPISVKLRDECLKRGPVVHAVCEFYKCAPEPQLNARDHMMDDGVHAIDTLRWLCGGEVTAVHSVARRVGTPDINFFAVLLEFDTGATGVLVNSWASGRRTFRIQVHSTGIAAEGEIEGKGFIYADKDTKGTEVDARTLSNSTDWHVYAGFRDKNRQFIDALKAGTNPESSFADAVKTMETAERILAHSTLKDLGG